MGQSLPEACPSPPPPHPVLSCGGDATEMQRNQERTVSWAAAHMHTGCGGCCGARGDVLMFGVPEGEEGGGGGAPPRGGWPVDNQKRKSYFDVRCHRGVGAMLDTVQRHIGRKKDVRRVTGMLGRHSESRRVHRGGMGSCPSITCCCPSPQQPPGPWHSYAIHKQHTCQQTC